ncbi:hypothetical protein Hanom_Chr05g00410931 [Helianthus anomalus]
MRWWYHKWWTQTPLKMVVQLTIKPQSNKKAVIYQLMRTWPALADRLLEFLGSRFLGPLAILRIWNFC